MHISLVTTALPLTQPPGGVAKSAHTMRLLFVAVLAMATISTLHAGVDQPARDIPVVDLEQFPKNLTRNHFNADLRVEGASPAGRDLKLSERTVDRNEAVLALLADDPTVGYPLKSGITDLRFKIDETDVLRRVQFLNLETRGTITIFGSAENLDPDDPRWLTLVSARALSAEPLIDFDVPPAEARYLLVRFQVDTPGRIAGFTAFGETTIADFIRINSHPLGGREAERTPIDFDYASLYSGARVQYMSSAADLRTIPFLIDDSPVTATQFAADDEAPLVVIDLGRPQPLNRVSLITSGRPGTIVEIYLRESRVEEGIGQPVVVAASDGKSGPSYMNNPAARSAADQAALASTAMRPAGDPRSDEEADEYAPVARIEDEEGVMRKSAIFDDSFARFILIRLRSNGRVQAGGPFTIHDVSAFGEPSREFERLGAAITIEPLSTSTGEPTGSAPPQDAPPPSRRRPPVPPVSP